MAWPPSTFLPAEGAFAPPPSPDPDRGAWGNGDNASRHASNAQAGSNWAKNPQSLCGTLLGDRYRLHRVQGRGQRSVVFRGECEQTGKRVTVKLLARPSELSDDHFRWEVRQAVALALFEHRGARAVVDFGPLDRDGVYLVRNAVAGVPLRELLQQGRLPAARALAIAVQVADALAAAHSMDVVHGQLTPENVLVEAGPERTDKVTVVDFGLADLGGLVSSNDKESRLLSLRSRLYAPAAGADGLVPRGPSADVYALAVMLFEMLAGQPPFAFDEELLLSPERGPALRLDQCQPRVSVSRETAILVGRLLTPGAALGSAATLASTLRVQAEAARSREPSRPRPSAPPPALPEGGYLNDPDPEDDAVTRQVPSVSEIPPPAGMSRPPPIEAFTTRPSGQASSVRGARWALQTPIVMAPAGSASLGVPEDSEPDSRPSLLPPPPSDAPPPGGASRMAARGSLGAPPVPHVTEYAEAFSAEQADYEVHSAAQSLQEAPMGSATVSLAIEPGPMDTPRRGGLIGFLKRLFGIPERPPGF